MSVCPSILIIDDEKNTRDGLKQYFENEDYDVMLAANGEEGFNLYSEEKPDLIIADIRMPKLDGIGLLEKVRGENPKTKVILMTAYGSVEDAVKAMKKGAFHYLTKPVNLEEMDFLVKKALSSLSLEQENRELKQALFQEKFEHGDILARSRKMRDILQTVEKIAKSNSTVLIEGESGTGKELIAHRIHEQSHRHLLPFIPVHCASLTDTLLPSELFGHEKGAFTGASERKVGRFERAHKGTLFLDEIGEITQETQVKLLRILQDGQLERVGGTKSIKVDVRLVCATNKKLSDEVQEGRFREDLFYRINVINLKIPPLRERKEDIPPLVQYFTKYFAQTNGKKIESVEQQAMDALVGYTWPGNVRELKNIVERMIVLSSQVETLALENVPEDIRNHHVKAQNPLLSSKTTNLNEVEKGYIERVLGEVRGNKSLAAKKLGISRRTLYRKLEEYKITPTEK